MGGQMAGMKRCFAWAPVAALGVLMAGCGGQLGGDTGTAGMTHKSVTANTAESRAFKPSKLQVLLAGFYRPTFKYSVRTPARSSSKKGHKVTKLSLEFLAGTGKEVFDSINTAFVSHGYGVIVRQMDASQDKFSATFGDASGLRVHIFVAPPGNRDMTAPDAVGTVYFQITEPTASTH